MQDSIEAHVQAAMSGVQWRTYALKKHLDVLNVLK